MIKIIQFIILIFFSINLAKGQFNIPESTQKIYPVQDYAGVLSKKQIEKLNQKLISYSKITSTEILVSIIQDLRGEDPNFLAYKWGEKWKIGSSHKNNGIVILLSINDRKISIQNGYGIEPYLTDFLTTKIIKKVKPILKDHHYYQAIDSCIQEIFQVLKNQYYKDQKKKVFPVWNLLLCMSAFLIMFFLLSKNKRIDSSLLNTLFLTDFLFINKKNHENEDNFDGFGGGGHFGGGGGSGNW
ncbi:TPM domain-containing protein [Blattabacterium sp. (Blattella germanica)]|uniref:TPM domain-containing protein n=1 Tax=Blattabacterium sp. (Blattella germanica) TaxID=624186 RepID=UPI0003097804|nr:TPM domain-containing protein [Blattabacterium sp. (Blattella germanica)]